MATQQHLYRRGPVYWWRRVLDLSPAARCDMRISLHTSVKAEARQRAGYLTAVAGNNAMITTSEPGEEPLAPDRRPTATQLKKVYRDGLDSALADFIFLQQELPAHPVINRQINEASADYYQWLIDTDDDKAAEMSAEYVVASRPASSTSTGSSDCGWSSPHALKLPVRSVLTG